MKPTMTFFWVEKKNLTDSRFRLAHFLLPQHYTQIPIYLKHHSRTKVQACKTRVPLDNCCHRLLQSEKKNTVPEAVFPKVDKLALLLSLRPLFLLLVPRRRTLLLHVMMCFLFFFLSLSPFCSYSLLVKLRVASRHSCAEDK